MVLKVGLTGGIGSGKTTVCKLFQDIGIPIIDADVITHEICQPNMPAYTQIKEKFGASVIGTDGHLDRDFLRSAVFAHKPSLEALENILHPIVLSEITKKYEAIDASYCIIAIPLLIEKNLGNLVDRILVIDAPEESQIKRAISRDNASTESIQAIMDSQTTREKRLSLADDIIKNDGDIPGLQSQIDDLHAFYSTYLGTHSCV